MDEVIFTFGVPSSKEQRNLYLGCLVDRFLGGEWIFMLPVMILFTGVVHLRRSMVVHVKRWQQGWLISRFIKDLICFSLDFFLVSFLLFIFCLL